MKRYHALILAIGIATTVATAAPVQAQNRVSATPVPRLGPASMMDLRSMMGTIINDPVIGKRMKELMAANPQFKEHFERMRATMSSDGMMMNGNNRAMGNGNTGSMGNGNNGSMMNGNNGSVMNGNNGSMMNGNNGSMHGQPGSPAPTP